MKNMTYRYVSIGTAVAVAAMVAGAALPAFAQDAWTDASANLTANATASVGGVNIHAGAGTGVNASLAARIANIVSRADQEITRRIDALNALAARVNAMVRLSDTEKSTLSAAIQSEIGAMNTLQSQVNADAQANSTSSIKTDVQSITKSYRIFALVLPQGSIEAASDRVLAIANIMTDLGTKLQARITAAQSAGNDTTAAASLLADFNAKVSDATAKANAAASEVASLAPDNGNAGVMASNTAALKDARSKIQAAQQDFVTARADASGIIKGLGRFKGSASGSATVSSSASTSAQ